jgi:Zn-dependent protease
MTNLYSFYEWMVRIRKYFGFSRSELVSLIVAISAMAFIAGFNFEGSANFNNFAKSFFLSLFAVALAVFAKESAQRLIALNMGYKPQFKPFIYGVIAGVILAFMTYGKVIFLAYGGVFLNIMEKHRLGYFRHQLGYFDLGKVSLVGPITNLTLAAIIKSMTFLPPEISGKLVTINVVFAITNALPIPPLDGANIMFASKTFYPLVLGAIVSGGLLLLYTPLNIILSLVASVILGFVTMFLFFKFTEPKLGEDSKYFG